MFSTPDAKRTPITLLQETIIDVAFLERCVDQFCVLGFRTRSRSQKPQQVLRLFDNFVPAVLTPAGYSQAQMTKGLVVTSRLNMHNVLPSEVPVFHHNLDNSWLDGRARPIEQMLQRLEFDNSTHSYSSAVGWRKQDHVNFANVHQIRTRFLDIRQRKPKIAAWNFVNLPNPTQQSFLPAFLKGPHASLLHDIEAHTRSIVFDKCDPEEIAEVNHHWRVNTNIILLAEAGAITLPHYDTFGYGTWITCLEGEIGFAWLPDDRFLLTLDEWANLPDGDDCADLGWRFKVLRPGDTVYFPPGIVHSVFRNAKGGQTMAASGSVLHYADLPRWIQVLKMQVADNSSKGKVKSMVPYLMTAVQNIIARVQEDKQLSKLGMADTLTHARVLADIRFIENSCRSPRARRIATMVEEGNIEGLLDDESEGFSDDDPLSCSTSDAADHIHRLFGPEELRDLPDDDQSQVSPANKSNTPQSHDEGSALHNAVDAEGEEVWKGFPDSPAGTTPASTSNQLGSTDGEDDEEFQGFPNDDPSETNQNSGKEHERTGPVQTERQKRAGSRRRR